VIENVAENDDDEIDVDSDAEPALVVNEAENELEDENEKMEKTLSEEVVDVSNIPLPPAITTNVIKETISNDVITDENKANDTAEVNVGYDDDENMSEDWEDGESLKLVLTDSAVSSVSQKKSFEEDEDDEISTGGSPAPLVIEESPPEPEEPRPEPVPEVFNHSTLPPPLPPRDNFLNTPIYYATNSDNFLQTPVHPFHFTEEEIEQELRSRFKIPHPSPMSAPKETPKHSSVSTFTQEKLLSDVAKHKMLTTSVASPLSNPATPMTPWSFVQTETSVDQVPSPAALPRTSNSSTGNCSRSPPPSTLVSPPSVHAQMLTDPSRYHH
jgi:hypothetical protein